MKRFSTIVLLLVLGIYLKAQTNDKDVLEIINSDKGIPILVRLNTKTKQYSLSEGGKIIKHHLKLNDYNELKTIRLLRDGLGDYHERFQHYYKGIKVEFSEYIAHSNSKKVVTSISGTLKKIDNLSVNPAISEKNARQFALNYYFAIEKRKNIFKVSDLKDYTFSKGELLIWSDWASEKVLLAYKFVLNTLMPSDVETIYVDAQNGNIIDIQSSIPDATAYAKYSGTVDINTTLLDDYILFDSGRNLRVYNLKKGIDFNSAEDFHDSDNYWSYNEFHNDNMDDAAINAYFGAEKTYDYFNQSLLWNRNGWDNNGSLLKIYAHYSTNFGNAKFDPEKKIIYLGDGTLGHDATRPWTAPDIIAHEYGHALYLDEVGTGNYTGEPGALQEGLSDIWGACVEDYINLSNHRKWLGGDNIFYDTLHCRNFRNPVLNHINLNYYQNSEETIYPDVYNGRYWYSGESNYTVHINCTVLDHWFYLICQGGTGTNSEGTSFDIEPLGMADAAKIVYLTEIAYLTTNSTFQDFRTFSIIAATNLFGANSNQVHQLADAWYAVGIGNEWQPQVTFLGSSFVCSEKSTIVIDTLPAGYSVDHFVTDYNIDLTAHITGGEIGNYCEVSMINQGNILGSGRIDAIIRSPSPYNHLYISRNHIHLGTPIINNIVGETKISPPVEYFYNADINGGVKYSWSYPDGAYPINADTLEDITLYFDETFGQCNGEGELNLQAINDCGWSLKTVMLYKVYNYVNPAFNVYPNPASDQVNISVLNTDPFNQTIIQDSQITLMNSNEIIQNFRIRILDESGKVFLVADKSGKYFSIPIYHLKSGNYIIEISNGKKIDWRQLLIQH